MLRMMFSPEIFTTIGFMLIFAGILIVTVAMLLMIFTSLGKGKVEGGGIIFLGPIPIIFGSNIKIVKILALVSIFLIVLLVILILLPAFLSIGGLKLG